MELKNNRNISDVECINNVLNGRNQFFQPLAERYWARVASVIRRYAWNQETVMDLCQETFFRAYSKLHLFDKKRTFLPWIMKIAVNISLKHIKKSKAKLIPLNETTMPSTLSLEDQVEANVLLEDCLKKLDINYQILFSLRHGLRLSYAEISFVLEESESSVKSALFRLRNQLKESVNAPGAKMKKIEATGNEK